MILKVGLLGATGRVGREVAALLAEGCEVGGHRLELSDVITSGKTKSVEGVECRRFGEPARENVHVWVDFSRPEATVQLLAEAQAPVVVATTGFDTSQQRALEGFAARHPLMVAPNTSLSMAVFEHLIAQLPDAKHWNVATVVEDEHHRHKKDSPSGTAKRILEGLAARGYTSPTVHVTRAGEIVGVHRVKWVGAGEELSLHHRITDRRVFAEGALAAAAFLAGVKRPGRYRMADVFGWTKEVRS